MEPSINPYEIGKTSQVYEPMDKINSRDEYVQNCATASKGRRNPSNTRYGRRLEYRQKSGENDSRQPSSPTYLNTSVEPEFFKNAGKLPHIINISQNRTIEGDFLAGIQIILLTGHKIQFQVGVNSNQCIGDLLTGSSYLHSHQQLCGPVQKEILGHFCRHNGEFLHIHPQEKIKNIFKMNFFHQDNMFTMYERVVVPPSYSEWASMTASTKHLFYLQLRQDALEGMFRLSTKRHIALGALALKADTVQQFGCNWKYLRKLNLKPHHYLPEYTRTVIGDRSVASLTRSVNLDGVGDIGSEFRCYWLSADVASNNGAGSGAAAGKSASTSALAPSKTRRSFTMLRSTSTLSRRSGSAAQLSSTSSSAAAAADTSYCALDVAAKNGNWQHEEALDKILAEEPEEGPELEVWLEKLFTFTVISLLDYGRYCYTGLSGRSSSASGPSLHFGVDRRGLLILPISPDLVTPLKPLTVVTWDRIKKIEAQKDVLSISYRDSESMKTKTKNIYNLKDRASHIKQLCLVLQSRFKSIEEIGQFDSADRAASQGRLERIIEPSVRPRKEPFWRDRKRKSDSWTRGTNEKSKAKPHKRKSCGDHLDVGVVGESLPIDERFLHHIYEEMADGETPRKKNKSMERNSSIKMGTLALKRKSHNDSSKSTSQLSEPVDASQDSSSSTSTKSLPALARPPGDNSLAASGVDEAVQPPPLPPKHKNFKLELDNFDADDYGAYNWDPSVHVPPPLSRNLLTLSRSEVLLKKIQPLKERYSSLRPADERGHYAGSQASVIALRDKENWMVSRNSRREVKFMSPKTAKRMEGLSLRSSNSALMSTDYQVHNFKKKTSGPEKRSQSVSRIRTSSQSKSNGKFELITNLNNLPRVPNYEPVYANKQLLMRQPAHRSSSHFSRQLICHVEQQLQEIRQMTAASGAKDINLFQGPNCPALKGEIEVCTLRAAADNSEQSTSTGCKKCNSCLASPGLDTSLSDSLIERFECMGEAEWEPTREEVTVPVIRSELTGKLGVKITQTKGGIFVESLDQAGRQQEHGNPADRRMASSDRSIRGRRLHKGDKILSVNGLSVEGKSYLDILNMMQLKSTDKLELRVSRIVEN